MKHTVELTNTETLKPILKLVETDTEDELYPAATKAQAGVEEEWGVPFLITDVTRGDDTNG